MAPSCCFSSQSTDHASPPQSHKHDVFLSFRGEDVRTGFVDHFHTALVDRNIRTYKDDQSLAKGETIHLSLMKAIEESRMAVVVFSKNYADSDFCLNELVQIMKCREEKGLKVVPVFYDVEVTDVRNQKNEFGEAFAKRNAKNVAKADIWRKAMVDVCKISRWELCKTANGHESQFIKAIIDTTISDGLCISNSHAAHELELEWCICPNHCSYPWYSSCPWHWHCSWRWSVPVIEIWDVSDGSDEAFVPTLRGLKLPRWHCCYPSIFKHVGDGTSKCRLPYWHDEIFVGEIPIDHGDKSKTNERLRIKRKKGKIGVGQKRQPVGIEEDTDRVLFRCKAYFLLPSPGLKVKVCDC